MKILCLSDVAVGYGSPQVEQLLISIADFSDDVSSDILLITPDQKRRAKRRPRSDRIQVEQIVTTLPPYDQAFQIEYNRKIIEIWRDFKPNIVIATHAWSLPAVVRMSEHRFQFIYYMLESMSHQIAGLGQSARALNEFAMERADVVIVPEKNRLLNDIRTLNVEPAKWVEILNVPVKSREFQEVPYRDRKRAILMAGSLGPQTMCERILSEDLTTVPFTIAGPSDTIASNDFVQSANAQSNISYVGMLPWEDVQSMRRSHAYSLVAWAPDNLNQIYAAPNKFFETIAAGTPPIVMPHPQCVEIVEKYQCGIVAKGWSEADFIDANLNAIEIFDTQPKQYKALIEGCRTAAKDMVWKKEFEKFSKAWL